VRLKIVQAGEPVLRQDARPLTCQEILGDEIQRLIHDMRETMRDAPGVGLAAPQIGLSLQLAVIEDREEFLKDLPPREVADKDRRPVPFPRDHQSSDHFDRRRRSLFLRRLPQPRRISPRSFHAPGPYAWNTWTDKESSLSGSIRMVCPDFAT
jgi:hypothetical protein